MFSRKIFVPLIALSLTLLVVTDVMGQRRTQRDENRPTLSDAWMEFFPWRSIGPANMSGRITSVAVYENDPRIWYVATASGGLLKTTNNGVDFEHQFDDQATVSIGDVQVSQSNPDIVWVGTGEANPRNSVSWGNGVYKSTDGGKTWKNMGLKESFQIGRIAIHPEDPEVVYVGALGRLWGPNEQRGLFKTTDGGENWEKIHFIDDQTGVIDVKMHPKDPETLLVATYERQRDGFDGNDPAKKYGEGSGLFRTTDGGKSFEKVTEGLPGCKLGRIGLDWYRKNPKFVYAIIESEKIASVPENAGYAGLSGQDADVGAKITDVVEKGPAEKAGLKVNDIVIQVNGKMVYSYNEMLSALRRQQAGKEVRLLVSRDRKQIQINILLAKRPQRSGRSGRRRSSEFTGTLGGQAANLQGQQGGEGEQEFGGVYRSKDAGVSWERINTLNPRPMYYSQIRVDPSNKDNVYVLGTSLYRSRDGGETFTGDGGRGIHPDNHALWIDPKQGDHMVLGCDGGIYVTWDGMDNWDHHAHVAIGQFYHVGIDHNRDYKVYGGLQDNGSWGGPAQTRNGGPINSDWYRVGGGDGFITLVDPTDADQIYFESQNGSMGRINLRTGERGFIRPRAPRGTRYRFNWKTPFTLSPHNPEIHYSAGNYVFRSVSKGDGVKAISPEITNTDRGAGSAISESGVTPGVLYVGTTDGAVWVTRDGGQNWEEIFVQREEKSEDEEETRPATDASPSDAKAETGDEGGSGATSQTDRRREGRRGNRRRARSEATEVADEKAEADEKADKKADEKRAADKKKMDEQKQAGSDAPAKKDAPDQTASALTGKWKGEMNFDRLPEGERWVEMNIVQNDDGKLGGEFKTPRSVSELADFEFDAESGKLTFRGENDVREVTFECQVDEKRRTIEGQIDMGRFQIEFRVEKLVDESVAAVGGVLSSGMKLVAYRTPAIQDEKDEVTGVWAAQMQADGIPEGEGKFTLELKLGDDGNVSGVATSPMGDLEIYEGSYNSESKKLNLKMAAEDDSIDAEVIATVEGNRMSGTVSAGGGQFEADFSATKEAEAKDVEVAGDQQKAGEATSDRKPAAARSQQRSQARQESEEAATEKKADADDLVTGKWEGRIISESQFMQGDRAKVNMTLVHDGEGKVKGVIEMMQNENEISEGSFKQDKKSLSFLMDSGNFEMEFTATVGDDGKMKGEVDFGGRRSFDFEASRTSTDATLAASEKTDEKQAEGSRLGDLVPGPRWVSSIEASRYKAGRVYLTLDGHRSNDDEPYVFVSENYGKTWTSIRGNLPTGAGSTRVVREDIENENLLFLGCEFSAWVSIDRGQSWTRFKGLPTVAVHEFAIHPTSGEIVAATHGRSLWVVDISGLRQLSTDVLSDSVALLKPNNVVRWRGLPARGSSGTRRFVGTNPDNNAEIFYYVGEGIQNARLDIYDVRGSLIRSLEADNSKGLHRVVWDLRRTSSGNSRQRGGRRFGRAPTVPAGQYLVVLSAAGQEFRQLIEVQEDPEMSSSATPEEEWELMKDLAGVGEEGVDDN